jgi:eukaryotic-like serine/threonine-protein kinase
MAVHDGMSEADRPRLTGRRIGPYEVGPLLGAGGMGEVYRARDTRLGRDVAIKILPADLTADPERLARFEREARVLARLNHPHIATIHGIEEADGVRALVLELVDGGTLADAIARGALPLDRFFATATALADAVAAAHDQGVTHRDIKPANVMVRADGRIKVVDFGIARWRPDAAAAADTFASLTADGRVLGTAAYMSPEQAAGRPVDQRSDIFSVGAVLYEMATGVRAFPGETPLAQLAAVLTHEPEPPRRLRPELPPALDAIIRRALEKDPARRYPTALQLRDELEQLRAGSLRTGRRSFAGVLPGRRAGLVVLLAVTGLGAGALLLRRSAPPAPAAAVTGAVKLTWDEGVEASPTISPDGRLIAYEHAGDIHIHDLDGGAVINLTPDSPAFDGEPAFSPDGRRIAFTSRREGGEVNGGIWVVDVTGGPARRLTNAGFSPAWSPDGREILYTTEFVRGTSRPTNRVRISALRSIDVQQGATRLVSRGDVAQPAWSPNGHRIAFWRGFVPGQFPGRFNVWTMRPDGSDLVPVTDDEFLVWNPVWSPDGRYVYFCSLRDGSAGVWRVAIDERSGRPLGEPQLVPLPASIVVHVALAATGGAVAWEASQDEANIYRIGFDPVAGEVSGTAVAVTSGTRFWEDIDIAPDGRVLVGSVLPPIQLWVSDADGSALAPLITDGTHSRNGRWSPDGRTIAFSSMRSGESIETWVVGADGTDPVQVSHFGRDGAGFFPIWSPDGSRMAITTGVNFGGEMFLVDPDRAWHDQTLEALRPPPGDPSLRYRPWSWSPDGRRIAAYSERGAGIAVYSLDASSWEIITDSGTKPRWLRDGRRLLYADAGSLFIVDVAAKRSRRIHDMPGVTLQDPAFAPGDTAIYFILARLERDIWVANLR